MVVIEVSEPDSFLSETFLLTISNHRSARGEFPPMGHISFVGKLDGDKTLKAGAPKVAPNDAHLMGKHSLDFWLTSEDLLPIRNNRGTINRERRDRPANTSHNEEGHKRRIQKLGNSDATADQMLGSTRT